MPMKKEKLEEYVNQGYSTWKIAELNNTTQPNIRYWLKKYNLKTLRVVNKDYNLKFCPKCKTSKPKSEFYISTKSSSYCKDCIILFNKDKQRITKQLAIEYKGGSCSKCGYNKCIAALEFHHIDSSTKEKDHFNFRRGLTNSLKSELDKCVLLCANCHREEHHLSTTNI